MTENQKPKRPYTKPELIQVPLRPEEAVLGFCKSGGGVGGSCVTTPRCPTPGS
jgi:hypothetical protein